MQDFIKEDWEWGFMATPIVNKGDERYLTVGVEEIYIPSDAKNKKMAKEFIKFLYSDKLIKLNAELCKAVVPIVDGEEYAKDFLQESNYNSFIQFKKDNVKALQSAFKFVENSNVNFKDTLFQYIGKLLSKSITVEECANILEEKSDEMRAYDVN